MELNVSTLVGVVALGLVIYLVAATALAHQFTMPPKRLEDIPVAGRMPPHEEVAMWSRDGVRLSAWYIGAKNPAGAVIMVHGKGGHKGNELEADALPMVTTLTEMGLSVLALDLRGHGQSDSARLSYGYHERLDVLGGYDWLAEKGYAAGTIGVMGASMGGAAAVAAAAEEPGIAAVVSDSSFGDFGAVLAHNFPKVLPLGTGRLFLPATVRIAKLFLGMRIDHFKPQELARELVNRRLFVIHSKGDRFITAKHAHQLSKIGDGELWVSDSRHHVGTYAEQASEYERRVGDFFQNSLIRQASIKVEQDTASRSNHDKCEGGEMVSNGQPSCLMA